MKKKSVAVGLAMVMMASVIFSGCGNAEKDSKKEAKDVPEFRCLILIHLCFIC